MRPSRGFLFLLLSCILVMPGCMSAYVKSVGGDTDQKFIQIYLTNYNTAWQAVLESLKSHTLDISNRDSGVIQTKWQDNTSQKNLSDSFGNTKAYLKAQSRYNVNVSKGFYNGKKAIKVVILKDQLIERDVLEGWKPIESDSIDEKTLLYRIGRLIFLRMEFEKLEKERVKKELENIKF